MQLVNPQQGQATSVILVVESTFNAAAASGGDPLHYDAPLSELGQAQVERTRALLRGRTVELVITTPLTRAL